MAVLTAEAVYAQASAGTSSTVSERVLVMPFENVTHDGRIAWLAEAVAIGLTDALHGSGHAVISRDERQEAFERLQVPPAAALTDATVLRLGQLVGATSIVRGTVRLDGDMLVVDARVIVVDSARVRHRATAKGPLADLFATLASVARQIAPLASGSARSSSLPAAASPTIAAFESYVRGLLAENPATAATHFLSALEAHPTYDRARLALWDAMTKRGDHKSAIRALEVVAPTSPEFTRARFLLGLSLIEAKQFDDAYLVYQSLVERAPTAAAFNNLGVIQLRRATSSAGPFDTPSAYFKRASDLNAADSDFFFNLGYAYWAIRDSASAVHWLREAVRRNPADGEAHYVLGAALTNAENTLEAHREKELARRLSSVFAEWDKRPPAESVPPGLERVKDDSTLPAARYADIVQAVGRDQEELAAFHVARGRRMYEQEMDRDATAELNRALFLSPYHPEANLLLGRVHQRSGRMAEAIGSYKISLWSAESAAAHAALASAYLDAKDHESARTEVARAMEMDPSSAEAKAVLDGLGRADR